MKIQLAPPSFWPEPRDPGMWLRVLRTLADHEPINDPRPCWETRLQGVISRRSVPGLYGIRWKPAPALVIGCGFLTHRDSGWYIEESARPLLELKGEAFQHALANWLVRCSPWVRLTIIQLRQGTWRFKAGASQLPATRSLRIGVDLIVEPNTFEQLPDARLLLGDQWRDDITSIQTTANIKTLSALASPLYLLHAMNWLSGDGVTSLPAELAAHVGGQSPADTLRRIGVELGDAAGFVAVEPAMRELWHSLHGNRVPGDLAAWQDVVISNAIDSGAIEVHQWAPGQPRHGRGFLGDRNRKLVKWSIHDNFVTPNANGQVSAKTDQSLDHGEQHVNQINGGQHRSEQEVKK
ncbi:MAG TPA: hypothetical protein PLY87_04655 [Planctomycetaceae bacterium]|nr:hypothetical protein [Planctomycetaceae bacterium]